MSPDGPPRGVRYRGLEILKDNVEAFTIALVIALVIKHFCVEAFKIPTSSMMPTLRGDTAESVGDRILVDKWAYLTGGPDRYDVIVFRHPLNRGKHYIKRVTGVGPEWLRIHQGDIWTRPHEAAAWRITQKRRRCRESLYVPVYPPEDGEERWGAAPFWEAEGAWTVLSHGQFLFAGGSAASLAYRKRIRSKSRADGPFATGSGVLVQDVRVRLAARTQGEARLTLLWRAASGKSAHLRLATDRDAEIRTALGGQERVHAFGARLVPGRRVSVEMECVDGLVIVHLDGKEAARVDEGAVLEDAFVFDDSSQRLALTAEGDGVEVTALRIDRDIWYLEDRSPTTRGDAWEIPADHYFVMGDNTFSSYDSRKWEKRAVYLRDGSEHWFDVKEPPRFGADGLLRVTDVSGIERTWREEDEDDDRYGPTRAEPFVPRELVVGRAFLVFWPLLPDFPGRLGFIH